MRRSSLGSLSARSESVGFLSIGLPQRPSAPRQAEDIGASEARIWITEVSRTPPDPEMVDRAVSHLQTVRLPQIIRRRGAYIEHLLWEAAMAEMSNVNVIIIHHSFCHLIWNTMVSEICTWCIYFSVYCRKPEYRFYLVTLYVWYKQVYFYEWGSYSFLFVGCYDY